MGADCLLPVARPADRPAPEVTLNTPLPTVTVVVPVHNGSRALEECLRALQGQDYPAESFDVVVVDNASTEDIAGVVPDDPRFVLLHEPRRGSYAARNTGLARARGEVLAFTDADCTPARDWLRAAVAELTLEPVADMVGGAVEISFSSGRARTSAELYEAVHGFPQRRYLLDQHFAVTANMVTWRRVLDRVGLFDAELQSRGDAQWGQRVFAAGGVQRFAAQAVVRHPARASWKQLMDKIVRVARGRIAAEGRAGRGRRHFLGVAKSQVLQVLKAISAVQSAPAVVRPSDRPRYLLALAVCRGVTAAMMVGAALSPRRAVGSGR